MRAVIVAVALILALVPAAEPATYYVDAQAGNDGNTGLAVNAAWRTLAKATGAARPGDIVRLIGTFTGQQLVPAVSGVQNGRITFEGAPCLGATLVGGAQSIVVNLTGRSFITLRCLRIRDVAPGGYGHAVYLERASDNEFLDSEILNVGEAGSDAGDSIWIADGSSRNKIAGNTLRNCGHACLYLGGDRLGQGEVGDNEISDNTLVNPWGTAIALAHTARRTLVARNTIRDVATAGGNPTSATIQISSRDHVISYNTFVNNAAGLVLSAYTYTGKGELLHQDAIGNVIVHNVFYGGLPSSTTAAGAVILAVEKDGREVRDNLIANNVLFRNAGYPFSGATYQIVIDHYLALPWPVGNLNGNRVEHNAILRAPGAPMTDPVVLRIRTPAQGGNLSYSLTLFQAAHPSAKGNLPADPLFVNAPGGDFHLLGDGELCWLRYDAAIRAEEGEKNIIVWMPLGGQVNTLKGKANRREVWAEAVFGSRAIMWGLGNWGWGCKSVIAGAC